MQTSLPSRTWQPDVLHLYLLRPCPEAEAKGKVGSVKGINTQGQWLRAGEVELTAGRHDVELERPGGGPAPGDGAQSVLGPVALVRREPRELVEVSPDDAKSLCGGRWDWIEVVR